LALYTQEVASPYYRCSFVAPDIHQEVEGGADYLHFLYFALPTALARKILPNSWFPPPADILFQDCGHELAPLF